MRAPFVFAFACVACSLLLPVPSSAAAELSATPSSVPFGEQCLGAPTGETKVTVSNGGDATTTISSITVTGSHPSDFTLSNASPRSLGPGDSFAIGVRFTARGAGDRSASIRIESNASSSPTLVPLAGRGVTRTLEVTPDRLVFGDQRSGASSDDLVVSLASVGTARVTLGSIVAGGQHAKEFSLKAPSQKDLDPGEDALLAISFRPRGTGARTATVTIESNACAGRTTVTVSGTGTAPDIRVSPPTIDLGAVALGERSQPVPVVVSNTGRAPLRITEIEVAGAQAGDFRFSAFPDLPKVLGPGEEFAFDATFIPGGQGPRRALLRIVSDDPDAPTLTLQVGGNLGGSPLPSPSASPSPSPSPSPSASPSPRALRPTKPVGSSGNGDWLAVSFVVGAVGGVFGVLFYLRSRRAWDA